MTINDAAQFSGTNSALHPLIETTLFSITPYAVVFERKETKPSDAFLSACAEIVHGRMVSVTIAYSDTRFAQMPFMPNLSSLSPVQVSYYVTDPSG